MDIDQILQSNDEHEILEFLTQNGCLQGAAHGIALQVMDRGRESLSERQSVVFEKFVVEKYFHLECSRCNIPMPSNEVVFALAEGDELCSWCRKMQSNDD